MDRFSSLPLLMREEWELFKESKTGNANAYISTINPPGDGFDETYDKIKNRLLKVKGGMTRNGRKSAMKNVLPEKRSTLI